MVCHLKSNEKKNLSEDWNCDWIWSKTSMVFVWSVIGFHHQMFLNLDFYVSPMIAGWRTLKPFLWNHLIALYVLGRYNFNVQFCNRNTSNCHFNCLAKNRPSYFSFNYTSRRFWPPPLVMLSSQNSLTPPTWECDVIYWQSLWLFLAR